MRNCVAVPVQWVMVVVLVGAGAGCGGDRGASPTVSDPAGTSAPRAVVEGPSTTRAGAGRGLAPTTAANRFEFVDYSVSGGSAAVNDGLKVFPDGRVVYRDGTRTVNFTVGAREVDELRAALVAADLPSLPSNSGTQASGSLGYRVIFGGQAVSFFEGAMPPSLAPAVAILNRLVGRGKQQR